MKEYEVTQADGSKVMRRAHSKRELSTFASNHCDIAPHDKSLSHIRPTGRKLSAAEKKNMRLLPDNAARFHEGKFIVDDCTTCGQSHTFTTHEVRSESKGQMKWTVIPKVLPCRPRSLTCLYLDLPMPNLDHWRRKA